MSRPGAHFLWPVRVYYEDTDFAGVVYHASYLRFMERARSEWLRHLGVDQSRLRLREGIVFSVSRIEVRYLAPGRFDDRLEVGVTMRRRRRASLDLGQEVAVESGELLCRAQVRIACVDASTFRPRALPPVLMSELAREH